jgi:hypothetical protein
METNGIWTEKCVFIGKITDFRRLAGNGVLNEEIRKGMGRLSLDLVEVFDLPNPKSEDHGFSCVWVPPRFVW